MTRLIPVGLVLIVLVGCKRQPPQPPQLGPAPVLTSQALSEEVRDYEIFTGRTEPSLRVDLRARVNGELFWAPFEEGQDVARGDELFVVDPRPYKTELDRAEAELGQAEARLKNAREVLVRERAFEQQNSGNKQDLEKAVAEHDSADKAIAVAKSRVNLARLNYEKSVVTAPFDGRISRRLVDPGNIVKADETIITTLVQLEPMYALFDVDERTLLRQLLKDKKLDTAFKEKWEIKIGLADEEGFPHPGRVNFKDNRIDTNTGTMWIRGQFVNPSRELLPGLFVRVQFPLGKPYQAVLIAEQAVGSDQGQKFVFVVDDKNKVEYRPVEIGRLQENGLRVIKPKAIKKIEGKDVVTGLDAGEMVVVSGLQRVRAGAEVAAKVVEMPKRAVDLSNEQ